MATRCIIGKLESEGDVSAIYCHWDGYPEGVGMTLMQHYLDATKVDGLMLLGSLSSLGPELGEKHPFSYHDVQMTSERYDELYSNMCVAYGRDRGEADVGFRTYADVDDFADNAMKDHGAEYLYLYEDGFWHCWDLQGRHINFQDMTVGV